MQTKAAAKRLCIHSSQIYIPDVCGIILANVSIHLESILCYPYPYVFSEVVAH